MKDKKERIWLEVSLTLPSHVADPVATFLTDLTGHGVKIEDLPAEGEGQGLIRITGYLAPEQAETGLIKRFYQYLADLEEIFPGEVNLNAETRPLPEEEWECAWQEYFKPIKVTKRLVIKPSWEVYIPKKDEIVIEIDPGRAFGTGHHPSTYLVLQRLESLFEEFFKPQSLQPYVLDVGTGTGILAIAAAKFGAREVVAVDIDPEAVEVARENVRRNHVHAQVKVSTTPVWELADSFDLIMANISSYALKLMAPHLKSLLNTHGHLLLSGFLKEEIPELEEVYCQEGLKIVYQNIDPEFEEWALLDLMKG